jgi:hypothetical protein
VAGISGDGSAGGQAEVTGKDLRKQGFKLLQDADVCDDKPVGSARVAQLWQELEAAQKTKYEGPHDGYERRSATATAEYQQKLKEY